MDAANRLYTLFYSIWWRELEHLCILVSMEGPRTNPVPTRRDNLISGQSEVIHGLSTAQAIGTPNPCGIQGSAVLWSFALFLIYSLNLIVFFCYGNWNKNIQHLCSLILRKSQTPFLGHHEICIYEKGHLKKRCGAPQKENYPWVWNH